MRRRRSKMDKADESSMRREMMKGVVLSQLAIIRTLMSAGVISKKDMLNELGAFIDSVLDIYPDAITILEPIRALQDGVSLLSDYDTSLILNSDVWLSDFIGRA
jgi:hypothetical protein